MKQLIKVPFLGANDSECVLNEWTVKSGDFVKKGVTVCLVETTKSVHDVDAEFDGYVYAAAQEGARLAEGDVLGLLSSEAVSDVDEEINLLGQEAKQQQSKESPLTKKAEILIARHKLDTEELITKYGPATITEELVSKFLDDLVIAGRRRGFTTVERIGVIGGASGGGALIVIDSIMRNPSQQAVAVFDADPQYHDKEILGVPVVGDIGELDVWLKESKLDKVVIAFNRNLPERKKVYDELKEKGVQFCNVIDPSASMRSSVEIGEGNVILGNVYIGACTSIGNNNFVSATVSLEHGNSLGSHCAFGPAVATSGNVTIGDMVRFGTGIHIEPEVKIGDGAVIASGSVLRSDVPDKAIVKMKYTMSIKERE